MAPAGDPEHCPPGQSSSEGLAPGLYITATPIGNAADITLRALHILRHCDAIVAEDTRVTAKLLAIHGISRPLVIYNEHNAATVGPRLVQRVREGQSLALVSDAGTPLISDPGLRLVQTARDEGLRVFPVPGPSAVMAALSGAGLPASPFYFAGFLPVREGERRAVLTELRNLAATLVFFEAPQRVAETLAEMAETLDNRLACVARELTKLHEEFRRETLRDLASHYAAAPARGEVVVLVAPPDRSDSPDRRQIDSLLQQALPFMPVKAAAALVAQATQASRKEVYARALEMRGRDDAGDE